MKHAVRASSKKPHLYSNRQLIALMLPLICEQIFTSFMGTVDSMMVSNVSEAAISAVSLVDSINILVIQAFYALASGGAIVCANYLGQKRRDQAERSANQLLFIIFAISLAVLAVCQLFRAPLLRLVFGSVEQESWTPLWCTFSTPLCPFLLSRFLIPDPPSSGRRTTAASLWRLPCPPI